MTRPSPWWTPHVHDDRRPFLLLRNRIRSAITRHFEARDFVEVDPCLLQISPGTRRICMPLPPRPSARMAPASRSTLHTSPEFACKKLLAAGERRLFSFSHVFRNRDAARCSIIPNSPCWSGIARVKATRP